MHIAPFSQSMYIVCSYMYIVCSCCTWLESQLTGMTCQPKEDQGMDRDTGVAIDNSMMSLPENPQRHVMPSQGLAETLS